MAKTTKEQIFAKPGTRQAGITGTIRRRQEKFAEEKAAEREKNIKKAEEYIEKIKKGEVTNINKVPKGARKYIDLKDFFRENKQKLKSRLEKANKKEKEARERYNKKMSDIREYYRESDQVTPEEYREAKADLREHYKPEIEYYDELSGTIKKNLDKLEKGEILNADSVINYAEDFAKSKERAEKQKYRSRLKEIQLKQFKEKEGISGEKVSKKEYEKLHSRFPTVYRKKPKELFGERKTETRELTSEEKEKIDAWMKKNKMTPTTETIRKIIKQPKVKTPEETLKEAAGFEEPKTELGKRLKEVRVKKRENIQQETKRYQDLGFKRDQAKVLAQESLEKGGKTFTPRKAREIIKSDIAKKQNKKIQKAFNEVLDSLSEAAKTAYSSSLSKGTLKSLKEGESIQKIAKKFWRSTKEYAAERYSDTRRLLRDIGQFTQAVREKGMQKLTEAEAQKAAKIVTRLEEALEEGKPVYKVKFGQFKEADEEKLEKDRKELQEIRQRVLSGTPSPTAMGKRFATDIIADVVIPGKFALDVGDILGRVMPSKEQLKKFGEKAEKEGIEKASKDLEENVWSSIKNFWTRKEDLEKVDSTIVEGEEEKKEIKKKLDAGEYENPQEVRRYLDQLDQEKEVLKYAKENVKAGKTLNRALTFIALAGGSVVAGRRIAKKLGRRATPNDFESHITNRRRAEARVKEINRKSQSKKIYEKNYFTEKGIKKSEIEYINNNILKKKVVPENVQNVKVRRSLSRIPGEAYIKKMKEKIAPETNIDIYRIRFKPDRYVNKFDVVMNLKDGTSRAFSVTSQGKIPFFRQKSIKNAIKYGTNKRVTRFKSKDDMVYAVQSRIRKKRGEARLQETPEDYFLGRRRGKKRTKDVGTQRIEETFAEVRRRPKVSRYRDLTPEQYWNLGEKVSVSKTKRLSVQPSRSMRGFERPRTVGVQKTFINDLKLDTSELLYGLSKHIEEIRKLPKSKWDINKLTRTEKSNILSKIYNEKITPSDLSKAKYSSKVEVLNQAIDALNASRKGKSTLTLKAKEAKKLSTEDFQDIQSAISSQAIPKVRYDTLKRKTAKKYGKVNKNVKEVNSTLKSSLNKVNNIYDKALMVSSFSVTKLNRDQAIKTLSDVKNKLESISSKLNKQKDILSDLEITLNKNIQSTTDLTQQRQLQDQLNKITTLKSTVMSDISIVKNQLKRIPEIERTVRPTKKPIRPRFPRLPTSRDKIKKKRQKNEFIGYNTFMKPIGKDKWKKVNKYPLKYKHAQDLGAFKADKSLQASFKVKKGSAPARKPKQSFPKNYFMDNFKEFRGHRKRKGKKIQTPGLWIEKAERRLDSPTEVSSIQKARKTGKSKKTKNKVKTAEQYWLR